MRWSLDLARTWHFLCCHGIRADTQELSHSNFGKLYRKRVSQQHIPTSTNTDVSDGQSRHHCLIRMFAVVASRKRISSSSVRIWSTWPTILAEDAFLCSVAAVFHHLCWNLARYHASTGSSFGRRRCLGCIAGENLTRCCLWATPQTRI